METIFTKIINGEIPASLLHSDAHCIAILDIAPVNKGHALVISRDPFPTLADCPQQLLGHMMYVAQQLDRAMRTNLNAEATNIIINNGSAAGQEVPHLHIHVIPRFSHDGKRFIPTKEVYAENEMEVYKEKLSLSL